MPDHFDPPPSRPVAPGARRLALVTGLVLIALAPTRAAEPPAGALKSAMLSLGDGGFVNGELKDCDRPGVLRWRGTPFAASFDFPANRVNAIHWPAPTVAPRPTGEYCFELAGGDLVFGSLVNLDDNAAELDVPGLGRLHVRRTQLHQIIRWRDNADLVYWGPNGLADWKASRPEKAWREDGGQVVTDRDGASIRGDLGLPARAAVEFEVSWKARPDFVLALGVGGSKAEARQAFRIEVWNGDLVAVRETDREADVVPLRKAAPGAGRAHLQVLLDQEKGRMLVSEPDGTRLADLKVAAPKPEPLGGVALTNVHGDVRLERLRIGRWDGEWLPEGGSDEPSVRRRDGSTVAGDLVRFDPDARAFVVRGKEETRIAEDQVARVSFPPPKDDRPRAVRIVAADGTRFSGDVRKVEDGAVWLAVPGIEETLRLPVAGLRALLVLHPEGTPETKGERTGRLEMDGVRLVGRLVDGRERPEESCLAWQPLESRTPSPLRAGGSGRIIYKDPPLPPPPAATQVQPVRQQPGLLGRLFSKGPATPPGAPAKKRSLYLRTGDVIPAEVSKIDEAGVWFRSPLSENRFVPHDRIKAVELAPELASMVRLTRAKRDRLLTLPRMQKDSPPTHLIRSRNGDYLRGRILRMDDQTLEVEVRLDTKEVPRDRVARIIWLHADEIDPAKGTDKAPDPGGATRVQAVFGNGIRLTFRADRVADGTLSGTSDVLGTCRVRLDEVDQVVFGAALETAGAPVAYQQWKLRPAPEPKAAQADDGGAPGGSSGTESALVGKPAPDFELPLVGGKTFHLADARGRVVVLDFWATWCGPCLQAMPQVERVAHEFRDQGVQLVAVNLQETAEQVQTMLRRHKLSPTVALDADGIVAQKYQANAIPQTVVIDREGNVARLFIGGGPHLGDQLRDALKGVLAGPAAK